jgi:hypothetical protein
MSERGKRTTIRFGGVRAEVSLVKSSTSAREPKHDTRRVAVEFDADKYMTRPGVVEAREQMTHHDDALPEFSDRMAAEVVRERANDAARRQSYADPANLASGHPDPIIPEPDPLSDEPKPVVPDDTPPSETITGPAITPAPTIVQQGVYLDDGTWIDLTDRLAAIDDATKLDGMEVVATIPSASVHRERIRDAHYINGVNPDEYGVLSLLWHALRHTDRAAVVVWTKVKTQALGVVVARGTRAKDAHLLLLEVEWAQNMREPGPKATGPIKVAHSPEEINAAVQLVEAFASGTSSLDDQVDTRLAKRGELLTLAREGRLGEYVPPKPPAEDAEWSDIVAAFASSAEALR